MRNISRVKSILIDFVNTIRSVIMNDFSLLKTVFLGVVLILWGFCTLQYTQRPQDYLYKSWGMKEGLPKNSVLSIHQQGKGYIWLGTRGGLVRFDGFNFKIYNKWTVNQIKNNEIKAINSDQFDSLWIGTFGGGVSTFNNKNWVNFSKKDGLASDYVNTISIDSGNRVWVGTNSGLNVIEKNRILRITGLTDHNIYAIFEIEKFLWIGCKDGSIFKVSSKNFKVVKKYNIRGKVIKALEFANRKLWIGTDKGLFYLIGGEINVYVDENMRQDFSISSFKKNKSGIIWIGTDSNGVFYLNKDKIIRPNESKELSEVIATCITIDHENSIWIGTLNDGLIQLRLSYIQMLKGKKIPLKDMIYSIFYDKDDQLWAGSHTRGLVKIKNGRISEVKGLSGLRIKSICSDSNDRIWIGTKRKGIRIISRNRIKTLNTKNGLCSDQITAIINDQLGRIWIGTKNGLCYQKGGSVTILNKSMQVNAFLEIEKNEILVATNQGLFVSEGDNISKFGESGDNLNLDITCLCRVEQKLFFGTNGNGLFYYDGLKVRSISQKQGLNCDYIFGIIQDDHKYLWLSSSQGIIRLNINKLLTDSVNSVYFNEQDGMLTRECTGNVFPSQSINREGNIYFSTLKGIAFINTRELHVNTATPLVKINDVLLENRSILSSDGITLNSPKNIIEFYYSGLSYIAPDKVRFKYMLEGEDDNWIEGGENDNRSVFYINLKPRKYKFKVKACNNFGIWSSEKANFSFSIRPNIFDTYWFYIYLLLLLVGSVFLFKLHKKLNTQKMEKNQLNTAIMISKMGEVVMPRLVKKMEEQKLFLNANLTLQTLARNLNINRNYLSRIINEKYKMKFNDFLNNYRIEEAKKLLLSEEYKFKNILAVAYDSGFNSKSAFNSAFKKITGLTPSQFKREILKK